MTAPLVLEPVGSGVYHLMASGWYLGELRPHEGRWRLQYAAGSKLTGMRIIDLDGSYFGTVFPPTPPVPASEPGFELYHWQAIGAGWKIALPPAAEAVLASPPIKEDHPDGSSSVRCELADGTVADFGNTQFLPVKPPPGPDGNPNARFEEGTRHLRSWVTGEGAPTYPLVRELACWLARMTDSPAEALRLLADALETEGAPDAPTD